MGISFTLECLLPRLTRKFFPFWQMPLNKSLIFKACPKCKILSLFLCHLLSCDYENIDVSETWYCHTPLLPALAIEWFCDMCLTISISWICPSQLQFTSFHLLIFKDVSTWQLGSSALERVFLFHFVLFARDVLPCRADKLLHTSRYVKNTQILQDLLLSSAYQTREKAGSLDSCHF